MPIRNLIRLVRRKIAETRFRRQLDWKALGVRRHHTRDGVQAPRVLIATSMPGYEAGSKLDSLINVALAMRGAQCDVLLCDAVLSACQLCKLPLNSPESLVKEGPGIRCDSCRAMGAAMFTPLPNRIIPFSELLTEPERALLDRDVNALAEEVATYISPRQLEEHARAGALRLYARGDFTDEPLADAVLECYRRASVQAALVTGRLLKRERYQCVVAHHGIYTPQGIINEICRNLGIRFVSWNPGYRAGTFIFSHGDTYHRTMISEQPADWRDYPWTPERKAEIVSYLEARRSGDRDWIHFNRAPVESREAFFSELNLDPAKPVIALLSNVIWDAQLHYDSNAFSGMLDWVFETISHFAARPELQLVIRVHPAEISGLVPSRQLLADEIARKFPVLPGNVFVIPPSSKLSTYTLGDIANAVVIYNTKAGIEFSARGKPVIVAGEAWIRGKGFSHDATSRREYFDLLAALPAKGPLTAAQQEDALIYAYHFFFRRSIELPFFRRISALGRFAVELPSAEALAPGNYGGLDVICSGILSGSPFVDHRKAPRVP